MAVFCMLLVLRFDGVNSESDCKQPAPLPGTDAVWTSTGIQYKCRYNYIHTGGDLLRNCTNGVYDGNPPVCEVDCGPVPEIENTEYTTTGNPMSSITYSCVNSTMIGDKPISKCSEIYERWMHTDITCFKDEPLSLNISHVLTDGDVNTCYTSSSQTSPQFSISLDDWYEFHQVVIVTQNVTHPNFTIIAKAVNVGKPHWRNCLHAKTTLPANTKTVFTCKRALYVRPMGDTLILQARYETQGQLQICELSVTGTRHIGDCKKPNLEPGQTVVKPLSTSPKSLTGIEVYCAHPWYPVSGNGHAVCSPAFQWKRSSLVCSREDWISNVTIDMVYSSIIDQNYSSCITVNNFLATVDLGRIYEIKRLIITGEASGKVWLIASTENKQCTRLNGLDTKGTYTLDCLYGPIGQYVEIFIPNSIDIEICEIKIQGREYDEPLECYQQKKGTDYKGNRNLTISGKPCLKWQNKPDYNKSSIFTDMSVTDASNYCRNPLTNQRDSPWCFTDSDEWEYCTVFHCDESCAISPNGIEYNGKISKSALGNECSNWRRTRGQQHMFNYYSKEDENFCRNRLKENLQPWCVTGPNTFETCHIPRCPKSSVLNFVYTSKQMMETTLNSFVQCQMKTPNESFTFIDNCWEKIVNNCLSIPPEETLQVLVTWVNESVTLFNIVCDDEQTTAISSTTEKMATDPETNIQETAAEDIVIDTGDTDIEDITITPVGSDVTGTVYLTTEMPTTNSSATSENLEFDESTTTTTKPTTVSTEDKNVSSTAATDRCKVCYCRTRGLSFNEDSLKYAIVQSLLLDKKNLSKSYRRKNSIPDYRPFALATGSVGIFVLVSVLLILVINDILGTLHL